LRAKKSQGREKDQETIVSGMKDPRRFFILLFPFAWVSSCFLPSPLSAMPGRGAAKEATEEEPGTEGKCELCGSTGRITCPVCKGQGNLRKPCPICNGKGRKPCPSCNVADPSTGKSATPGKTPCPACNGKGVIEGAEDRPCFRCKGAKEFPCQTCMGKGDVSCPKTRYEKTCPRCGFVGKIPCPACRGGKEETPSGEAPEAAATRDAVDLPATAQGDDEETGAKASRIPSRRGYTEANYLEDQRSAESLKEEVESKYREFRKVQSLVSTGEIKRLRTELARLNRSTEELKEAEKKDASISAALAEIQESRRHLETLDRSWGSWLDGFDQVEKTCSRARAKWDDRPIWRANLRPSEREAIGEEMDYLSRFLSAARKSLASVDEEKPTALGGELKAIKESVEGLRRSMDKLKSKAKEVAQAKAKEESGRKASQAILKTSIVEASEKRGSVGNPSSAQAETIRSGSSGAKDDGHDRIAEQSEEPEVREPVEAGFSRGRRGWSSNLVPATIGILAIAFCGGIYFFLHRKDSEFIRKD
jgi:hypothetical protein